MDTCPTLIGMLSNPDKRLGDSHVNYVGGSSRQSTWAGTVSGGRLRNTYWVTGFRVQASGVRGPGMGDLGSGCSGHGHRPSLPSRTTDTDTVTATDRDTVTRIGGGAPWSGVAIRASGRHNQTTQVSVDLGLRPVCLPVQGLAKDLKHCATQGWNASGLYDVWEAAFSQECDCPRIQHIASDDDDPVTD